MFSFSNVVRSTEYLPHDEKFFIFHCANEQRIEILERDLSPVRALFNLVHKEIPSSNEQYEYPTFFVVRNDERVVAEKEWAEYIMCSLKAKEVEQFYAQEDDCIKLENLYCDYDYLDVSPLYQAILERVLFSKLINLYKNGIVYKTFCLESYFVVRGGLRAHREEQRLQILNDVKSEFFKWIESNENFPYLFKRLFLNNVIKKDIAVLNYDDRKSIINNEFSSTVVFSNKKIDVLRDVNFEKDLIIINQKGYLKISEDRVLDVSAHATFHILFEMFGHKDDRQGSYDTLCRILRCVLKQRGDYEWGTIHWNPTFLKVRDEKIAYYLAKNCSNYFAIFFPDLQAIGSIENEKKWYIYPWYTRTYYKLRILFFISLSLNISLSVYSIYYLMHSFKILRFLEE